MSVAKAAPVAGASSIARGSAHSLLFRLLAAVSDVFVVVVTTRGFGEDGRGLYSLTSFAAASTVLFLGGASMPMRTEVGRRGVPLGRLHGASVALAALALAASTVVVAAAVLVGEPTSIVVYVALAAPALLLVSLQVGLFQARGDLRRMHFAWLGRSVVPLLALAALALAAPGDIHLALFAWCAAQVVVPLVALRAEARIAPHRFRGVVALLRDLVRRGAPVSLYNGVALVAYRIDLLLVATLLTLADVGRYSVALATAEGLWLLSRAVTTGAYERIISAPLEESIRVTVSTIRHALALTSAGGIVLVLLASVLFGPVFGDGFADTWKLLPLLLPSFLAVGIAEILSQFLLVRVERPRHVLIGVAGYAAGVLVLGFVLVSTIGTAGAALATSTVAVLQLLYVLRRFAQLGGPRRLRDYLPTPADVRDELALARSLIAGGGRRT